MRAAILIPLLAVVAMMTAPHPVSSRDKPVKSGKPKQSVFLVGSSVRPSILFLRKAPWNCCCPADSAGEWGGRPRIMLVLKNQAAHPLWLAVRLTPPSSYPACEHRSSVAPKEKTELLFTQDSVLAGEYAVHIMAFADSASAD